MSGRNADIRISWLAVLLNSIATVVIPAQAGIQVQSHLNDREHPGFPSCTVGASSYRRWMPAYALDRAALSDNAQ